MTASRFAQFLHQTTLNSMPIRTSTPRRRSKHWLLAGAGFSLIVSPAVTLSKPPAAPHHTSTPAAGKQGTAAPVNLEASFDRDAAPVIQQYCTCHGNQDPAGGVSLLNFKTAADALRDQETWQKVARNVATRHMPPAGMPAPTAAQRERLVQWVKTAFAGKHPSTESEKPDPGRVTLRRLNRAEYNNTIRDLLGVDFQPAEDFPIDDVGYGFDDIGDVLSTSPLLTEKYLNAAERIAEKVKETPDAWKRLVPEEPPAGQEAAFARRYLGELARRAYRRPVTPVELDRLVRYVDLAKQNGDDFDRGMQVALEAVLVSPPFLFRVELDPRPNDPAAIRSLNDYELATRLSYFLWSSMPDDTLLSLADQGRLHDPSVLAFQVGRMLHDPKAQALTDNFAGQWLELRNLSNVTPDPARFPQFNDTLRQDMKTETELYFQSILNQDRSVVEFLDSRYTFLNEDLAKLYGIPGVTGSQFRRVTLNTEDRGGILTQASILTITSNPNRTSPVKRGKWVLEQILGTPPPQQPPNIPALPEGAAAELTGTVRQRLEQHRKNPICASCHAQMDPLGFGLDNFGPIGEWRDKDGNFPVDSSGTLPDGRTFRGPAEMKRILLAQKDQFVRCLAEKMLTYALGRGLERYDRPAVDGIVKYVVHHDYRFGALMQAVVQSDPFRRRRGDDGQTSAA